MIKIPLKSFSKLFCNIFPINIKPDSISSTFI